jgi:hypothetical protein
MLVSLYDEGSLIWRFVGCDRLLSAEETKCAPPTVAARMPEVKTFQRNVMRLSAVDRLYEAVEDSHPLEAAYDNVLKDLFGNPFWQSGPTVLRRVLWTQGERARTGDSEAFAA